MDAQAWRSKVLPDTSRRGQLVVADPAGRGTSGLVATTVLPGGCARGGGDAAAGQANELPAWRYRTHGGVQLPRAASAGTTGPGQTCATVDTTEEMTTSPL